MVQEKYTHRSDFPEKLPDVAAKYCWTCHNPTVGLSWKSGRQYYICATCHASNTRFLTWDPNMQQSFNESGYLVHYSAGVCIMNERNELLLFLRQKFPFLYTIPSGHLEVGEDEKECAEREVHEETGLVVTNLTSIFSGIVKEDSCPGGADIHNWNLYRTHTWTGDITLNEEGSKWAWFAHTAIPKEHVVPSLRFFLSREKISQMIFEPYAY